MHLIAKMKNATRGVRKLSPPSSPPSASSGRAFFKGGDWAVDVTRTGIWALLFVLLWCVPLHAAEYSPQWMSTELKTGFWLPADKNIEGFFGKCCNLISRVQTGLLIDSKYGLEGGVGFFIKNGKAVGRTSGTPSADSFGFYLIPLESNLVYRADFIEDQIVVPYVKGGIDYVFFRESDQGKITKGFKYGFHGTGGLQILMEWFDQTSGNLERGGLNNIYLTLEANYQRINDFGKGGLDLSGWVYSAGLLFEY